MKIGELARRINTPSNTLRYWCKEYGQYLSDGAKVGGLGTVRNLSERDALVLATIADLRSKGLSREQIVGAIEKEHLIESLPDEKTAEEREAQKSVALVPLAQLHRALDQIQVMQSEINRLIEERDKALIGRDEASQRISELQHELGRARGVVIGLIVGFVVLVVVAIALFTLFVRYLPQPS